MKGWLIYESESAKRNKKCIEMYFAAAEKRKIDLELKIEEQIKYASRLPNFVIMRAHDWRISCRFENMGIPVFNNSFVSKICNDKEKTYKYMKKNNIPVMETRKYIGTSTPLFDFPFVVKPVSGHGGEGVSLVHNIDELKALAESINNDKIIIQKCASDIGRDLRIYVIDNKIIAAMLRVSKEDFRSNYCLGGTAVLHSLTEKERRLAEAVIKLFDFSFAGIDLIYHNGEPVLNEIEDIAGARMIYSNTDIDIIDLYVNHVVNSIRRRFITAKTTLNHLSDGKS